QASSVGAVGQPQPEGGRGPGQGAEGLAAPEVPHPDRPVRAGGSEGAPVGGVEGHVGDRARVAAEGQVFRARLPLHGTGVPDPNGLVHAGRGEPVTVGAEGHAEDVVDVAAQREDFLPGRCVPELDRLIQARGREAAAVGAEGHAPQRAHVPAQAEDLLPGLRVPDLDFPVGMYGEQAADRGEAAAVAAEGHALEASLGGRPVALFPAGLRVPYLDPILAARGELPAIGTELDAADGPGKTQRKRLLTRVQVPDLHFPFLQCFLTGSGGQALTVRTEAYPPHPQGVFPAKEWLVDLALKGLLHVPNLDCPIPASPGAGSTAGPKLNAGGVQLVSLPFPEFLPGRCLTESDKAILRGRGQVLAVRAERDAIHAALVAQRGKGPVPQPFEVAPFPVAQILRT